MPHDVFISYSHKDKAIADAACASLEREGVRVWIAPRDISPGAEWGGAIIEAINNCKAMLLIFSASANDSPQIRREVERAVNKEVPILPFRIQDVEPTQSLEYFIGTLHWLDAMSPPMEQHLQHLTRTVKALVHAPTADPEAVDVVKANEAVQRSTHAARPPPMAAASAPAQHTNWLMWTTILIGVSGVFIIAVLWIVMSGRNQHEVAAVPPPGAGPPANIVPGIPNVPQPPPPASHAHEGGAQTGAVEKWGGLAYAPGAPMPSAFDMELTFGTDGTISGTSTDVSITSITNLGMPIKQAIIDGRVEGTRLTFTKNFGDANDKTEYTGTIDAGHRGMAGTWRHGNEHGTFTANISRHGDDDDDEVGSVPGFPNYR